MTISALAKKLHIRPNSTVALCNAPSGMDDLLTPLPDGGRILTNEASQAEPLLLFVQNSNELAYQAASK